MRKSFLEYPFIRDKTKRRYMLNCLKAFLKSGVQRTFYDLGRVGYWGPQTKGSVDFQFDETRTLAGANGATMKPLESPDEWRTMQDKTRKRADAEATRARKRREAAEREAGLEPGVMACGGGTEQLSEAEMARFDPPAFDRPAAE
jgi:anaerobic magnesium-protoporphyrin IX monomethyl ester cyclase